MNPELVRSSVKFGDDFELELSTRRLRRAGRLLRLERIPFQILVMLIERRGQLVTREEIVERIWGPGVFLDTDNSINGAIRKIRHVLRDNTKRPAFIETVTGKGYIFISRVDAGGLASAGAGPAIDAAIETSDQIAAAAVQEGASPVGSADEMPVFTRRPRVGVRAAAVAVALMTIVVSGVIAYGFLAPWSEPKVLRFVQPPISNRAEPWHPLVSDGKQVYFLERAGDQWNLMQTSGEPGEATRVEGPFRNTRIFDISKGGSEFLIGSFEGLDPGLPLWIWRAGGGNPTRVGDLHVDEAIWSPDAASVIYARESDIRMVNRDGANDRLLIHTDGKPHALRWSPNGRRLSYSVGDVHKSTLSLWEAHADGSNARVRIPPVSGQSVCCGSWSNDGRYFFYTAGRDKLLNLWAVRDSPGVVRWPPRRPVQLTTGATATYASLAAAKTNRIFAFVDGNQFESVKYDPESGHYAPFLRDVQAVDLQLAPGGTMVAFQRMPDGSLWRSSIDGAQRVQLVGAPLRASHPRWSPDATTIAFEGRVAGRQVRAYVVSAAGGAVQEILPGQAGTQSLPAWSPDGGSIALALNAIPGDATSTPRGIFIVDWKTRNATRLPGSDGLTAPLWSPDGKYLIAKSIGERRIVRFDSGAGQWIEIATGNRLSGTTWSQDSSFLDVQDLLDPGGPVYRYRVPEFRRERVFSVEPLLSRGIQVSAFRGWAPDGSVLMQLTRVGPQIFGIDLDLR